MLTALTAQDLIDVLLGLLEADPTVRMSVGEAHRALYTDADAAKSDPAPNALAGVQRRLSSRDDGGTGRALDAKRASKMVLSARRARGATKDGEGEGEEAGMSQKKKRSKKR